MWSRVGRALDHARRPVGEQARRAAGTTSPGRWRPGAGTRSRAGGAARRSSGGSRSSRPSTSAPISRSGSTTRSTGRRRIDSSPSSVHSPPGCPASQPGSRRSRVPALPTSIARRRGAAQARRPTRSAGPPPAPRRSTSAPERPRPRPGSSACRRRRGSCAIAVSPSAIAARSAARWEIDLSGGGGERPAQRPGGLEAGSPRRRRPRRRRGRARGRPRRRARPPRRRRPRPRSRRCACRAPGRAPCPRC